MKKVVFVIIGLVFFSNANAEESRAQFTLGFAISGPVYGLSLSAGLGEHYRARIIYRARDLAQFQLHYYPVVDESKHYLFGVGQNGGTTYVRGAIGKDWYKGSWIFNSEIGLNIPLEEEEGLLGGINKVSYLILVGAGVHYQFK